MSKHHLHFRKALRPPNNYELYVLLKCFFFAKFFPNTNEKSLGKSIIEHNNNLPDICQVFIDYQQNISLESPSYH